MKGDAQPLIKFFDGSDKRFIIPLYQRNYDWKEENCEQLFQDLMKLHNSDRRSHFFGSISVICCSVKTTNWRIDICWLGIRMTRTTPIQVPVQVQSTYNLLLRMLHVWYWQSVKKKWVWRVWWKRRFEEPSELYGLFSYTSNKRRICVYEVSCQSPSSPSTLFADDKRIDVVGRK